MPCVNTANDFMRRKLVMLTPHTKVVDGVTLLLKNGISGAPVVDADGSYLGMFSEKCCMNALTETVETAEQVGITIPRVAEFMTKSLITLSPDNDVFNAIDHILAKQISGAPVLDKQGNFIGIFSEKTAMRVLVSAAYDQLPGTNIEAYMNTDSKRLINQNDSLVEVARKFQQTPYRRLPVLDNKRLIGQVSRRDVIRSEHRIEQQVASASKQTRSDERLRDTNCSREIEYFMDRNARTISSGEDWLSIAQIFLNTPYRRLAVVESGKLLGQVSRRDLLSVVAAMLRPTAERHKPETLYISPIAGSLPPS